MKASLLNPLPHPTAEAFNPNSADYWEKQTPGELSRHIVRVHLDPYLMRVFGVPNFDLEVAQTKGFSLQNLANNIVHMLEEGLDNFYQYSIPLVTNARSVEGAVGDHATELIKTLIYIDQLQPGTVNWQRVIAIKSSFLKIDFDYQRDCRDSSFFQQMEVRRQIASALYYSVANLFKD